jgi:hypothetical protein
MTSVDEGRSSEYEAKAFDEAKKKARKAIRE